MNPFQHFTRDAPPYVVRNSLFTLLAHGGPHVDAGIHIFPDGGTVNDFTLDQFVGPLRLVDVRNLPKDQAISRETIEESVIRQGDIVVLFGGYEPPREETQFPEYHCLSAAAAEYLASIPVRAFATDGWSVDARGSRLGPVVHEAFLLRGIPVIEQLVNLAAIPEDGEILFVGLPLNVADANGAPMRAAAFVYE
ncbi:MAG: cyclase family protein [Thermoanaerobaculia bacterium]|nr:cyclase family protein [Thermoanaerobaculia bacterium]